ncbi:MAG: hypothetical protein H6765_10220 [Candidatus Peribacteria bacterium]|nr:MAG: hypothetical protein H6765_10220 [Candidatus Peribacteria bacterium]
MTWQSYQTVTVDYYLSGVTATDGEDYAIITGTLTYAPYDTSEVITFNSLEDDIYEPAEIFKVKIHNPTNANI